MFDVIEFNLPTRNVTSRLHLWPTQCGEDKVNAENMPQLQDIIARMYSQMGLCSASGFEVPMSPLWSCGWCVGCTLPGTQTEILSLFLQPLDCLTLSLSLSPSVCLSVRLNTFPLPPSCTLILHLSPLCYNLPYFSSSPVLYHKHLMLSINKHTNTVTDRCLQCAVLSVDASSAVSGLCFLKERDKKTKLMDIYV